MDYLEVENIKKYIFPIFKQKYFPIQFKGGGEKLFESAILSIKNNYLDDVFEIATYYLTHVANNHCFVDGNKRMAILVSCFFLAKNKYKKIRKTKLTLAKLVEGYIEKSISQDHIIKYFKDNYTREDR